MIPGLILHQEQCEITCDADAKSSRNARGARQLSRMPQRQKRHIPGVASGWRDASENPSGGAGPRGAEGLENAARTFLDNRRGGFRKARNPKWARNDLERGESKARKVSDAAREGGAEKRGALVRQGAETSAKARKCVETPRGYRQGWRARPAVKQRASNGCRPNDRFWVCVANRTHLGRIPCGKRSEDGALLSWTHDPDADSGSGTIREGSLAPKIPLGSLAPRRVPHSSGFGFPESKRRKGNRVRVLAVSMIASQGIRPRYGDRCVLAKLNIASIRKRGTRMASERFLGPKRYPSEAARLKRPQIGLKRVICHKSGRAA